MYLVYRRREDRGVVDNVGGIENVQTESSETGRSGHTVVICYPFGRKYGRFIVMPIIRKMVTSGERW